MIVSSYSMQGNAHFGVLWSEMQREYNLLLQEIMKLEPDSCVYAHPYWHQSQQKLKEFIGGSPNANFAANEVVASTMLREKYGKMQQYETCYLKYCVSDATMQLLNKFQDNDFINLPKVCKEFNCSINTLGHLFYAARVIDSAGIPLNTIVELGGGYGNLARIFKTLLPEATLILFDLPELVVIQGLFLKVTIGHDKVIVHHSLPDHLQAGFIHLIPIQFAKSLEFTCDAFVSTFALSETPELVQKLVSQKNFFNAQFCYIVGQMNGDGGSMGLVNQNVLLRAIRLLYGESVVHPYHYFFDNVPCYELIARSNASDASHMIPA